MNENLSSTLTLYSGCRIVKGANFVPEDLEGYLSSLVSVTIVNFQYVKFAPELDIKVAMPQNDIRKSFQNTFNYATIRNNDWASSFKAVPFFVDRMEWTSSDTIRARLSIDLLNAFNEELRDASSYGTRTRVFREHRRRYRYAAEVSAWVPVIDRIPENMGFPLVRKASLPIYDPKGEQPFTAVYYGESTDSDAPVNVAFVPNNASITLNAPACVGSGSVGPNFAEMEADDLFYVAKELNHYDPSFSMRMEWMNVEGTYAQATRALGDSAYSATGRPIVALAYKVRIKSKNANNWRIYFSLSTLWYNAEDGTFDHEDSEESDAYPSIKGTTPTTNADYFHVNGVRFFSRGKHPYDEPTSLREIFAMATISNGNGWATEKQATSCLSGVSKTAPTLQKLVNLPYFPATLENDGTALSIPEGFAFSLGKLLRVKEGTLPNTFTSDMGALYKPTQFTPIEDVSVFEEAKLRDGTRETKILNSEFFYYKVVYDTFSLVIEPENRPFFNPALDFRIEMDFTFASEFSGAFLLAVRPLSLSWVDAFDKEDFPDLLAVSRNNESPVYTSSYLNYVKTGYNFDLKNKTLTDINNVLSTVLGALSTGVGIATGNGSAVTGVASFAGGVYTGFANQWRSDLSLAQRIKTLQNQGASMSGVGDYSLMRTYNGEMANMFAYEIDPAYKGQAIEFMELYGYATEKMGAPELHSRARWNFVQCDFDLNTDFGKNLPEWAKDALKAKFAEGVTFLHRAQALGSTSRDYLDFDQKLENFDYDEEH